MWNELLRYCSLEIGLEAPAQLASMLTASGEMARSMKSLDGGGGWGVSCCNHTTARSMKSLDGGGGWGCPVATNATLVLLLWRGGGGKEDAGNDLVCGERCAPVQWPDTCSSAARMQREWESCSDVAQLG
jgi:hypothetical protein